MRRLLSVGSATALALLTALAIPVIARGDLSGSLEILDTQGPRLAGKCDPDGTSSLRFTATGEATGPYPGTFEVRGEFVIEPQTLPGGSASNFFNVGPLISFHEEFTIYSGAITITGSKSLTTAPPDFGSTGGPINTGFCLKIEDATLEQVSNATGRIGGAQAFSTFNATIQTPEGSFDDSGNAFTIVGASNIHGSYEGNFKAGEFFQDFIPIATP